MVSLDLPVILRGCREALNLSAEFVGRELGVDAGTIRQYERDAQGMPSHLIDTFAQLYGVDAGELAAEELNPARLEGLRILLLASGNGLTEETTKAVASVAAAQRELVALETELVKPSRYDALRARFRHDGVYGSRGREWQEGRRLAEEFRAELGLAATDPIKSMRDLAEALGIELVGANLKDASAAGFSLADREHGPAIVVNVGGQNANPWTRRFTIAHEVGHVLHDELNHKTPAPVQRADASDDDVAAYFQDPAVLAVERRANGFAAHLLCPDDAVTAVVHEIGGRKAELVLRTLTKRYGINFKAARYRLQHVGVFSAAELSGVQGVPLMPGIESPWTSAEMLFDHEYFPCPSIPPERRHRFARVVVEALTSGILRRHEALNALRCDQAEPIEQLAEFFVLPKA